VTPGPRAPAVAPCVADPTPSRLGDHYSRPMPETAAYRPLRAARSRRRILRHVDQHWLEWGDPGQASPERPTLVLLHGWMDVGASFQFVVDELAALEGPVRHIVAPDWRGFGLSTTPPVDAYWFPDYLGDLDALLRALAEEMPLSDRASPVDLVGHSMGGNVVMSYAGVRPTRLRRLVNLEGFGLPASDPSDAPARLARWLDELATPATLGAYDSRAAVAARLRRNNPRLTTDRADWLAGQWASPRADGRWHVRGDAAHKHVNPTPYRVDEALAAWRAIRAPTLWVEGGLTDMARWWGDRYPRAEFEQRLAVVPDLRRARIDAAGHMLHHDEPATLARLLLDFLA
jgi:pimeloyl-ACP methyl ester carboxylesterase